MTSKESAGAVMPSGELVMDLPPEYEQGDYRFDGKFYQTVDEQEYIRRQETITSYAQNMAGMPVEAYQKWVELDWKKPHGTYEAAHRLTDKIKEEACQETPQALDEAAEQPNDTQLRHAAADELGDVFWTINALASNASVNSDRALQSKLWGDGLLSKRVSGLTLGMIDGFIAKGLTPYMAPLLAEHAGDDLETIKLDEMEPHRNLLFRTVSLALVCEKQFGYNDTAFFLSYYQKIAQEEIAPMVSDQILLVAWYAYHLLGSSLAEVVGINVSKLRQRVERNLVDKSDGPRD